METIQFKTTIKCAGCMSKATPFLNEAVGEENWAVDLTDPLKVLTVVGESDSAKIIQAVEKAGYKAEKI